MDSSKGQFTGNYGCNIVATIKSHKRTLFIILYLLFLILDGLRVSCICSAFFPPFCPLTQSLEPIHWFPTAQRHLVIIHLFHFARGCGHRWLGDLTSFWTSMKWAQGRAAPKGWLGKTITMLQPISNDDKTWSNWLVKQWQTVKHCKTMVIKIGNNWCNTHNLLVIQLYIHLKLELHLQVCAVKRWD